MTIASLLSVAGLQITKQGCVETGRFEWYTKERFRPGNWRGTNEKNYGNAILWLKAKKQRNKKFFFQQNIRYSLSC